jgi:hypothetical protein
MIKTVLGFALLFSRRHVRTPAAIRTEHLVIDRFRLRRRT